MRCDPATDFVGRVLERPDALVQGVWNTSNFLDLLVTVPPEDSGGICEPVNGSNHLHGLSRWDEVHG